MNEKHIILIVDDTPENLRLLGDMLEQEGYEVMVATNGPDALENARGTPAPDLILLDIMMPDMDGYEVCRRLKSDADLKGIPVIFISALGMTEQKVQGFREGAVDYVTKPFQAEEVLARVNTHIMLARAEELKREIAERKKAEEKNLRLAAIVQSSDDAIIGADLNGNITNWNRGAEKIFAHTEGEVIGMPLARLVPPDCHEMLSRVYEKVRQGESVTRFETVHSRKDRRQTSISFTFSPVTNGEGRVVAISTIGRDISERVRAEHERMNNARINRELEIAQEIQKSFLGACPEHLPGMLIACLCLPAAHVGGDYYDFFTPEDGVVDVAIADVSGHSISSALLMAEVRSVLHAKVTPGRSTAAILAAVNDLIHDDLSRSEHQISMFYVRIDTKTRAIAYANAGHTRPLLYRRLENAVTELDADGMLMGVRKKVLFEENVTKMESGDVLFLYTDGITDTQNSAGEMFGTERLCEVVSSQCGKHPEQIISSVLKELTNFAGNRVMTDDVSMVAITVPERWQMPIRHDCHMLKNGNQLIA